MPAAAAPCADPIASGTPSISMRPASGRYMPVRTLTMVDLPAPFSPIRAVTSPG